MFVCLFVWLAGLGWRLHGLVAGRWLVGLLGGDGGDDSGWVADGWLGECHFEPTWLSAGATAIAFLGWQAKQRFSL
jgi:hypothetical protein